MTEKNQSKPWIGDEIWKKGGEQKEAKLKLKRKVHCKRHLQGGEKECRGRKESMELNERAETAEMAAEDGFECAVVDDNMTSDWN